MSFYLSTSLYDSNMEEKCGRESYRNILKWLKRTDTIRELMTITTKPFLLDNPNFNSQ